MLRLPVTRLPIRLASASLHRCARRQFSAKESGRKIMGKEKVGVELEYERYEPPTPPSRFTGTQEHPIVIVHGLLGSKRNWDSLAKVIARDLDKRVYTLDLRNHGQSPHAPPMTYEAMASDIKHFCVQHRLAKITLIGHSMGGKAAMAFALDPERPQQLLKDLIIVDIAPAPGPLSPEFAKYIETMGKIEKMGVTTRKEAENVFMDVEKDPAVRAFLLTNFVQKGSRDSTGGYFRVPVPLLAESVSNLGSFPYEPNQTKWDGRTLFIKGEKSPYLNQHNIPLAKAFFPNMALETVDAGHWVHAERPYEFKALVETFVRGETLGSA